VDAGQGMQAGRGRRIRRRIDGVKREASEAVVCTVNISWGRETFWIERDFDGKSWEGV
jgi:hypothetical protein